MGSRYSRLRRLAIFVFCGPVMLVGVGRGCPCRRSHVKYVTDKMVYDANAKLKPGEHKAEEGAYHNNDEPYPQVGIHYLTAEQAQRYGYGPDAKAGNYVGSWYPYAGLRAFHPAGVKYKPEPKSARRDTAGRTLQPGARGRTRTRSGHSN